MINHLVTVIIPVYNNVEYLEVSLASVVSQTYPSI
jgi:glycosyltransferase involved in cell wall biosynthesis